jgi:hypothetical protein
MFTVTNTENAQVSAHIGLYEAVQETMLSTNKGAKLVVSETRTINLPDEEYNVQSIRANEEDVIDIIQDIKSLG